MKLSIIVPCYNESSSVRETLLGIQEALRGVQPPIDHEVVFVDDGSADDTCQHLLAVAREHDFVRVIRLAGNVGSHMAVRAGLEHASGTHAMAMAADLQEPPELIPRMLALCEGPIQVVWAVRTTRDDTVTTKFFASLFHLLAKHLIGSQLQAHNVGTFLIGPKALAAVSRYPERNLTLEGLFCSMGFPYAVLPYERQARKHGGSKWTLAKKLKLFADFFVAYSYTPIRFFSYLGVGVASLGFLYASYIFVARLIYGSQMTSGFTAIMIAVLILGGLQMIMMGVLGEYLWRTLDESRRRPRYLVDEDVKGG